MRGIKHWAVAIIALIAMIVGFTSYQPVPTAAASKDLAAIQKRGYLVVGLSADYAPLEFHATINGADTIVGADISMSKQIAKDMGVKLQIKEMNFTALIGALKTGKIDLIVSGMSKTPEREKEVNFSTPYLYETQVMVIRKADKAKYKSIADFSGKRVGAQKQTTQEQLAKTQLPGAKVTSLDKANDVVAQISYNKLDAGVLASTIADSYVARTPSLTVIDPHFATDKAPTAIAVSKQSPALLKQVNKTISKVKGVYSGHAVVGSSIHCLLRYADSRFRSQRVCCRRDRHGHQLRRIRCRNHSWRDQFRPCRSNRGGSVFGSAPKPGNAIRHFATSDEEHLAGIRQ